MLIVEKQVWIGNSSNELNQYFQWTRKYKSKVNNPTKLKKYRNNWAPKLIKYIKLGKIKTIRWTKVLLIIIYYRIFLESSQKFEL